MVLVGVRIAGEAASPKIQEVVPVKGFIPHLPMTQRRGGAEGRSALEVMIITGEGDARQEFRTCGDVLHNSPHHCFFSTPELNCSHLPRCVLALGTWPASRLSKPRGTAVLAKVGYSQHILG